MILFQFSPLREGRQTSFPSSNTAALFQFSPLREGRRSPAGAILPDQDISILAPARGATLFHVRLSSPRIFQFSPLREGRQKGRTNRGIHGRFQFSPLREGRPDRAVHQSQPPDFNSRPCERGDNKCTAERYAELISILAPARGATALAGTGGDQYDISILAPARGATAAIPRVGFR